MSWIQIEIKTSFSRYEPLESLLLESGACSVTFMDAEDHPIYEPSPGTTPLWNEIMVCALFPEEVDVKPLLLQLKNSELGQVRDIGILEDKAWEKECMKDFHPMQFGENLWVCPGWCTPPDPEAINVILDPGCGFGTGTHPTTSMCLQWLSDHDIQGKQVIDYGCGSGILGIAASLLGAQSVIAVDIDFQALDASSKNAQRNGLDTNRFKAVYPDRIPSDTKADILLANILSGPLIDMSSRLASMIKPQGRIVLSGVLTSQAESVKAAYTSWFDMEIDQVQEEWARLSGTKRLTGK